MEEKDYKVCATCVNFESVKHESGMQYRCSRLGFDTKPTYSFDCWNPKPHVLALMNKRSQIKHTNTKEQSSPY